MKFKSIRGVKDILPGEVEKWQFVESTLRKIFPRYGFQEIRLPIFENTNLFKRSIGETTDIVEKEMYTFKDRGGEEITLRPEGTASVVRSFIEHKMYGPGVVTKLYYLGPMFRYERPQAGRFRQFYQIGVEAMGSASPTVDVEVMSMLIELFKALGLEDLELQINSLGCKDCRPQYRSILKDSIKTHLSELCSNCNQRYERNPLRVLDCKVQRDREIAKTLPQTKDHLCEQCKADFQLVQELLDSIEARYTVNGQLVRGLDYYTKTTFEVVAHEGLGSQNAVCGGGRYDSLVKEFDGPETPCFGFAVGMERLISIIPEKAFVAFQNRTDLFVIILGETANKISFPLIHQLRASGLKVEREVSGGSLKSQMRKANKMSSRFVLIIGENEVSSGKYVLKNMDEGSQTEINAETLISEIENFIK